ncbi:MULTISPECIES: superinfection exclusion B family protein [Psychromonas]|uniref:superinfection exclusion B family protein n=1 Tax=Psychromonas TaxID=67572 RepID=UPI0004215E72|nr:MULTISPECIES: superinfection exclusion B family protein [Psychromonas]MBB1271475.1 superinfection exclusion B family protein [Psychromonas sp. SR45-3]
MKRLFQRLTEQQGITTTMMWMCFSCAVLLVMPSSLFSLNNSDLLPNTYAPYLWILALLTGSYLLTRVLTSSFSRLTEYYERQHLLARRNKMIRQLDFEEKALLREFIIQRKTVLALPLTEPAVSNLLASGVLAPAFETQEIKGSSRIIKLSIAIDAREQLTHKVIGLPTGKLTEAEAEVLKAARPQYARNNYISL